MLIWFDFLSCFFFVCIIYWLFTRSLIWLTSHTAIIEKAGVIDFELAVDWRGYFTMVNTFPLKV